MGLDAIITAVAIWSFWRWCVAQPAFRGFRSAGSRAGGSSLGAGLANSASIPTPSVAPAPPATPALRASGGRRHRELARSHCASHNTLIRLTAWILVLTEMR